MLAPLAASISKVTTMRDKTVRLQIDCQEMPPESMSELFALNDRLGWFYFKDAPFNQIDTKDLPEIKLEVGEKSPGQRLRAVLYLLWKQGNQSVNQEQFYREQMEKIIQHIKEKLT